MTGFAAQKSVSIKWTAEFNAFHIICMERYLFHIMTETKVARAGNTSG